MRTKPVSATVVAIFLGCVGAGGCCNTTGKEPGGNDEDDKQGETEETEGTLFVRQILEVAEERIQRRQRRRTSEQ